MYDLCAGVARLHVTMADFAESLEAEYEPEREDIGRQSDSVASTCVEGSVFCVW